MTTAELRNRIKQIQVDHYWDEGKHLPESDDCEACLDELAALAEAYRATGKTRPTPEDLTAAVHRAADYLYTIDGEVTPEQARAINTLRQLINEEFVAKGRTVSNQVIFDILKEVI